MHSIMGYRINGNTVLVTHRVETDGMHPAVWQQKINELIREFVALGYHIEVVADNMVQLCGMNNPNLLDHAVIYSANDTDQKEYFLATLEAISGGA